MGLFTGGGDAAPSRLVSSPSSSGSSGASSSAGAGGQPVPPPAPAGGLLTITFQLRYNVSLGMIQLDPGHTVNRAQGYHVRPGQRVTIMPLRTNVNPVAIGLRSAQAAAYGPNFILSPTDQPIEVTVENTNEIFLSNSGVGNTGDGVTIMVRQG